MVFSFSVEPRQPNTASASSGGGSDKKKSEETRSDKARLRGLRKRARYVAKKIRKRPSSLLPQVTKYMQLKDESVRDCTTAEREEYSSAVKAKVSPCGSSGKLKIPPPKLQGPPPPIVSIPFLSECLFGPLLVFAHSFLFF